MKVVLAEDSAAVAGVLVALAGLVLVQVTHNRAWDAIASIAIGAILVLVAYAIGRDAKQLLIGEAATAEDREAIERALDRHPAVVAVSELLRDAARAGGPPRRRQAGARGRPLHDVSRARHGRASAGRPPRGRRPCVRSSSTPRRRWRLLPWPGSRSSLDLRDGRLRRWPWLWCRSGHRVGWLRSWGWCGSACGTGSGGPEGVGEMDRDDEREVARPSRPAQPPNVGARSLSVLNTLVGYYHDAGRSP